LRILLTGRTGQVGWELERMLPAVGYVIATDRTTLDVADGEAIRRLVREVKPDVIVNAAAYTAVDRAESEPATAMQVNAIAPEVFAHEAARLGARLVHYSTDYVFDGEKNAPYLEDDVTAPINVYGQSKLEGEKRLAASGCQYLIFRTSWVYAARGRNFLLTILKASREKPELNVVDDQVGAPTSSAAIARATLRALQAPRAYGVYHMTAAGKTTWFGFAQAILQGAGVRTPMFPIGSNEYPAKARRPRNSLLDNTRLCRELGITLSQWEAQLEDVMSEVLLHDPKG
jgi:dTDP-4-dehydrorhamnose reductase